MVGWLRVDLNKGLACGERQGGVVGSKSESSHFSSLFGLYSGPSHHLLSLGPLLSTPHQIPDYTLMPSSLFPTLSCHVPPLHRALRWLLPQSKSQSCHHSPRNSRRSVSASCLNDFPSYLFFLAFSTLPSNLSCSL